MKKRILITAGIFTGLALLLGISLVAGINVVRAASQAVRMAVAPATAQVQQGQPPADEDEKGVLVVLVEKDGPAAKAGMRRGDIIIKATDKDVNTASDLQAVLTDLKSGDSLSLTLLHGDDERTLTVTLGERNGRAYLGLTPVGGPRLSIGGRMPFSMPKDMPHTMPFMMPFGITETHAIIVEVVAGSPAEKAGLQKGDMILSVDGKSIGASTNQATH
jgi:serine protease Do